MATKFYVKNDGKTYLGGFDGAEPPAGSIEVSSAPTDARLEWNGTAWVEPEPLKDEIADEKRFAQVREEVSLEEKVHALWLKAKGDNTEFDRIDLIIEKANQDFPKP